ncbi:MAG: LptF/LptG family permease, partial [SAR324 cluster bacterium]|nr:LptF/LptG family permease [SAR324 cluster bacterium]
AFPVQLFVMVFLGLSLSSSHSRKGMAAESMALSCLLAILFWILNQILLALGDAGEIHPLPASWGSIGLFALIAWLLHFRYRV